MIRIYDTIQVRNICEKTTMIGSVNVNESPNIPEMHLEMQ